MDKWKRIFACLLTVVLITGTTVAPVQAGPVHGNSFSADSSIEAVSLLRQLGDRLSVRTPAMNRTSLSLEKGSAYTLHVSNAKGGVAWSSSDGSVAAVSSRGVVRALTPGDAVITAKNGKNVLKCNIHVYGAEFTPGSIDLVTGGEVTLKAALNGRSVPVRNAFSADPAVAAVSSYGRVKARGTGSTVINVRVRGARYAIPVTVRRNIEVTTVELTADETDSCVARINEYLEPEKLKVADVVKAVDVSVRNADGATEIKVDNVFANTEGNDLHLYHIRDTDVEELDFELVDNSLIFTSDSFSPFLLADVQDAEVPAKPVGLRIEVTADTNVYTYQTLFTSHGELAFSEGYNAYVRFTDGSEIELPNGTPVEVDPWCAPAEEGPFDCTLSYTCEDGTVVSDTIRMNAVHPEPVMDTEAASRAAGLRGIVNGQSLKHIIFTDTEEPAAEDCATKAYIGRLQPHAVVAYRLNGQEDTLYITSGHPGVKVIHPGGADTIDTGSVEDVDCRMLDTGRCTTVALFRANGGGFQNSVKSINFSGCDFSNVETLSIAFDNYTSLQYLDLSGCQFPNVKSMSHMCYGTPNLVRVDMSGTTWGAGVLENLEYAFGNSGLQEIDLGDLETSAVTTVRGMFFKDRNLRSVDLSRCDFTNVTDAASMFRECGELTGISMPASGMPNLTDSIGQMFDTCTKLRDVDLSGLDFSKVSNVSRAFYRCESLCTVMNIDATLFDRSSGYTFADMAIGDEADVVINCTQASRDILEDHMIRTTDVRYTQHVTYNITDAVSDDTP